MSCCSFCRFPDPDPADTKLELNFEKMSAAGEQFVDLEEIVRSWANDQFEKRKKLRRYGKIKSENLRVKLIWDRVSNVFEDPVYFDMKSQGNHSLVLFRSNFVNSTEQDQQVSFKTERTSRSACIVCIERGYTIGNEFELSLKAPEEIVEANAGFKRELELRTNKENTIEEELIWSADSQVKVSARSEALVQLEVNEERKNVKFNMKSTIRGTVVVSITNLKDNNSVVATYEGGIAEIVQRDERYQKNELPGFTVQGKTLTVETVGSCGFVYGIGQQVNIAEKKLDKGVGLTLF